jgi:hypothetical protein
MPLVPLNREVLECQLINSGERGDYRHLERHAVTSTAAATLVSSALGDSTGRHAPCLDVDVPAALTVDDTGLFTLWVDGLSAEQWAGTQRAMLAAGLLTETLGEHEWHHRERLTAFRAARTHFDGPQVAAGLRAVGAQATEPYDQVLSAALAACDTGHPSGAPVTNTPPSGCDLTDPWPFKLAGPAVLLPSTSNHHLFLETPLTAAQYENLLRQLLSSGWVEPGYIYASLERAATHLRLAWIAKSADPSERLLLTV